MKPAKKNSMRGQIARALTGAAQMVAGVYSGHGGFNAANRNSRRTRGWKTSEGSAAADILPGLEVLRGRSRDLERNNPLALGAIQTKANGVVGSGLKLRAVLDREVLRLSPEDAKTKRKQIEQEWALFERECDFAGGQNFKDLQRLIYRSARVSGDIGIVRRYKKRPGETYGVKLALIEADRISNPNRRADSETVQGGVQLSASGAQLGCHISDRHPGDLLGRALKWGYVPFRGRTGMRLMILYGETTRPGQVRGVPLFAPIEEILHQLGEYSAAEVKAAINDAYLFATEETAMGVDGDGNPLVTRPDDENDEQGELTLEDLTITTLPEGRTLKIKKPERPNTAFGNFMLAMCREIGVALDLPLEVLLKHFTASFSASRGALEIAYKGFLIEQDSFVRQVIDVVREWQFTEMVASGRFDAPGFFDDPIKRQAWLGRQWIGPTRVNIDPGKEAKADEIDIKNNVKTHQQVMTERTGGDFDTKSDEILEEQAKLSGAVEEEESE